MLYGQLFDVFDQEEIKKLCTICLNLANQKNTYEHDHIHYTFLAGFTTKSIIYPYIKKILAKIEKHLDKKLTLHIGKIMVQNDPLPIHTDYVKGDNQPDLAIVIPLNVNLVNTSTIIFAQQCQNNFYKFKKDNKKLEKNAKELHNISCSHVSTNDLEYVSVLGSYQWIPQSVIYWDRSLLHCSDNFKSNGLEDKIALVLFTTKMIS